MEQLPARRQITTFTCTNCGSPRSIIKRTAHNKVCSLCRKGEVIRAEDFYQFWLERFTLEELREIGWAVEATIRQTAA